ncbi:hypothetical protein RchiOBHm_Chr6g0266971 [Rosa chinensis]|uniref:Uncharacterized protein n=1 Tax=Rosa chinensis TaxID=74649 RepID=A0A2P6PPT3_ROSCH|nr:hypothetical protein RchiOBHm_Chr6g0266971 [Rosa chinensis]
MASSVSSFEDFEFLHFEDSDQDSLWEFIDLSDSDDNHPHPNSNSNSDSEPPHPSEPIGPVTSLDSPIASPVADPIRARTRRRQTRLVRLLDLPFQTPLNFDDRRGHDDDDVGGDEEDDDGYGLDDELVPWSVSDRFGRERMRKLGKRTFPKMQNSKRSPYLVVRPGCVRGKHGLGLKHIY